MAEPLKRFSDVQLKRLMRFWQKKLRLQDWRTEIRYARESEMDGAQGLNDWNDYARTSEIKILHPDDYDVNKQPNKVQQDIEDTVVHELVHLHLCGWKTDGDAEERCLEQAVESITGALIALRRRTK